VDVPEPEDKLVRTSKIPQKLYISDRVAKIDGKSVAEALETSYQHDKSIKLYKWNDLKYDCKTGYLQLQKKVLPTCSLGINVSYVAC
jgi:hypothetical protein